METKAKVFVAYAHEDMDLKEKLTSHLKVPAMREVLDVWQDGEIKPGVEWESDIHENLNKADVILILVSVHSLNSDFFLEIELKKISERHNNGISIAIPVILRPCQWQFSDFAKLQALPDGGKPIVNWPNEHEVLSDIAAKVKERAISISADRNRKIQELELDLEKHLRDDRRGDAQLVLGKLETLFDHFGDTSGKIKSYQQRVAEMEKIQHLRDYLKELENTEKNKDWDAATSLFEREFVRFDPGEIATSRKSDLINSLLSNIEDTSNRIRRKSEASILDAKAEKAFVRKDYEVAQASWEQANALENKSERINRIRQCEERIRDRKKVAEFEDTLDRARKIRDKDPVTAQELLETAVQLVKDEKLESSEEGERVKERLKAASQELDEIKDQVEINQYAVLLKNADEALHDERYPLALNHFLAAQELNPNARIELESKIQSCRLKLRVQLLREAADEFERRKDYIRAQGMHIALVELSPEDGTAKKKIQMIDQILEGIDKDYAQARAKGEKFLLQKQFEEAIKYFDHCHTIKPDDNYTTEKKEEARKKMATHQYREQARKHFNDGKDFFKANQYGEAKKQFSKALRFAQANEEIKQYLDFTSQLVWAERLFSWKFFSFARKIYQNLPPEIKGLTFVEQRIAQCEQSQKFWGKYSSRYSRWLLAALLLIAAGFFLVRMNAANKTVKLNKAIMLADSQILQGNYSDAAKTSNSALEFTQNDQDKRRVRLRSQVAGILLTVVDFEKQAAGAGQAIKAIPLQDSALIRMQALPLLIESVADSTANPLIVALKERQKKVQNSRDSLVIKLNVGPLQELIKKGNSAFGNKDFKQALSFYEKTSEYSDRFSALPYQERSQVIHNLSDIQSRCNAESQTIQSKINGKNSDIEAIPKLAFKRKSKINAILVDIARMDKQKNSYDLMAAQAGRLMERFR
ncbi:MAG: TIR domain-containing protein [Saprospiraceae bacterium]